MDVVRHVMEAVWELASTKMNVLGYQIAPMDFWITMAILYMLTDIMMWYLGWSDKDD